ncbi:MAG: hypothetical protein KF745_02955 [Phycisphaeraceae bacterium]|nr:hypothetical protein [Phycisphaeraceae bacterium]
MPKDSAMNYGVSRCCVGFGLAILAVLAAGPSCSSPAKSQPGVEVATNALVADDPRLADLAFLAGSWVAFDENGDRVEEHWTAPSAGTMLGTGRTISPAPPSTAAKTVFFEYLRIEWRPDGVVYLASPVGRCPPTPFRLVERGTSPARLVFENPKHDFPNRISYSMRPDGFMDVRVEGTRDGAAASESWRMQRAR